MFKIILFYLIFFLHTQNLFSEVNRIVLVSTTSTTDTGLMSYINKNFYKEFKIRVDVLSLGTGQAIEIAKNGNADILLVHHTPSEIKFVEKGYGLYRHDLMYNDFLIVGPKDHKGKCESIKKTLKYISNNSLYFLSRADDSGTNKKEIELWNSINMNINKFDNWYKKIGQGMGSTLMMSNEMKAYTLTDRGTWISFNHKDNLKVICENYPPLHNQYGIILVNPELNKKNNHLLARKYINWILSEEGKELINNYTINGKKLFYFNYK